MTWNPETLDELPGEGEEQVIRRVRYRHACHNCGENAHFKQTYLMDNARRNPASSAYGKDDCSWSEDEAVYFCKNGRAGGECRPPSLPGYGMCSTFPATKQFAHMFLYWHEVKEKPADALRDVCPVPPFPSATVSA